MQIRYRTTRHTREVADSIGRRLVASRIADEVGPVVAGTTPEIEFYSAESVTHGASLVAGEEAEDISPRTGKPKRKYRRRDMRAED